MDRRIINTNYSAAGMELFAALARLCVMPHVAAYPPVVEKDGITVRQSYAGCSMQSGLSVYYRLDELGENVLVYDPEIASRSYGRDNEETWEWKDSQATTSFPLRHADVALILYHEGTEFPAWWR